MGLCNGCYYDFIRGVIPLTLNKLQSSKPRENSRIENKRNCLQQYFQIYMPIVNSHSKLYNPLEGLKSSHNTPSCNLFTNILKIFSKFLRTIQ